jgi:hypothetical protein
MRHLPVIDNGGKIAGIMTRKDLMRFLIVEQEYRELSMIRRVQRAARVFIADRRKKYARLFLEFAIVNPGRLNLAELKALALCYRERSLQGGNVPLTAKQEASMMDVLLKGETVHVVLAAQLPGVLTKLRQWHFSTEEYKQMHSHSAETSLELMNDHFSQGHAEKEFQRIQGMQVQWRGDPAAHRQSTGEKPTSF